MMRLVSQESAMPRFRVLVVDDEPMVTEVVERYLVRDGFDVSTAEDGDAALVLAQTWAPDLVVLDLMLPGKDGLEVCRTLRRESSVPIIMLTARGDETDRIVGLEIGADDYVTKPFSPKELLARVRAAFRRTHKPVSIDQYGFQDVSIDFSRMELKRAGRLVEMTPQEFKILKYFAQNPERVISRDELLNEVWGYNSYPVTRTVDNHILKLRQKLEADPENPVHFRTVHGAGYKFVP